MTGTIVGRVRSFLVHGAAVVAVVLAYAFGSVGINVLSVVGISSIALTTSVKPADAQRWRRGYWRRRVWRRRRWW